jgi:para-nitrobenzyl esterase
MVGGGPEPQLVADQMSAAWIAFARTGNPNTPALPQWPPYEMKDRATMVFDTRSTLVKDFREGERSVLAGIEISGTF